MFQIEKVKNDELVKYSLLAPIMDWHSLLPFKE